MGGVVTACIGNSQSNLVLVLLSQTLQSTGADALIQGLSRRSPSCPGEEALERSVQVNKVKQQRPRPRHAAVPRAGPSTQPELRPFSLLFPAKPLA